MKLTVPINTVHLYTVDLATMAAYQITHLSILSPEEITRAKRFVFPIHHNRFIAARASLRLILSQYLAISPQDIQFDYSDFGKPFLQHPSQSTLQFNLAHSGDLALYAITTENLIGVDIETIQERPLIQLAKRFFSKEENMALSKLPQAKQLHSFYHLWACKEALIKASGKGLSQPLSSFSVSLSPPPSTVTLEEQTWSLVPLAIQKGYAAALASNQPIHSIVFCTLSNTGIAIKGETKQVHEL